MGVTRTPFSGPALCELEWFLRLFLAVFTLTASPLIFVEGSPRYPSHATRACLLILFELLQHLSSKLFRHVASGTIVQDSEIQAKSRCFLQARLLRGDHHLWMFSYIILKVCVFFFFAQLSCISRIAESVETKWKELNVPFLQNVFPQRNIWISLWFSTRDFNGVVYMFLLK